MKKITILAAIALLAAGCGSTDVEEAVEDEVIEEVIEEPAIEFIGNSGSYHSESATMAFEVEEEAIKATIYVDLYETELVGEITSDNEAVMRMEMGEEILCSWINETTVWVEPVSGFHEESIALVRMICEALNGYAFKQNDNFSAKYTPVKGYHINSNEGGFAYTYSVTVNSISSNSFTFTVVEEIDANRKASSKTVVENGTAYFKGVSSPYAYYESDAISLEFDCTVDGVLKISGYEPMERLGENYSNLAYLMGW